MTKIIEDDDFENDLENDFDNNSSYDDESDCENDDDNSSSSLIDEYEDINIIIEIDDDELDLTIDVKPNTEENDIVLSKHKMEGKHSLKYDSIFKGKKEEAADEDDTTDLFSGYYKETIEV